MARHGEGTAAVLAAIAAQILRRPAGGDEIAAVAPGITLFRVHRSSIAGSGVLQPSVCVVVQGAKLAQAGETTIRYRAGDFLVSSIELPLAGHPVGATAAKPYLAVGFALPPREILDVAAEIGLALGGRPSPAVSVGRCDVPLLEVVLRSVASLDEPREAAFLAPRLRQELIYRLVTGPSARNVLGGALAARPDDGIGRAIHWIRANVTRPLDIAWLARMAGMSTSTLRKKFKAAVLLGPLQYQKRLRLEEGRRLLLAGHDATRAAFAIGYESPSQFTREYRRQFGAPPLRDTKRLRGAWTDRAEV